MTAAEFPHFHLSIHIDDTPQDEGSISQPVPQKSEPTTWRGRAIAALQRWEDTLAQKLPANPIQSFFDDIGSEIKNTSTELADNIKKQWESAFNEAEIKINCYCPKLVRAYKQLMQGEALHFKMVRGLMRLAKFLSALPFHAAFKISRYLYLALKAISQAILHPVRSVVRLMQFLVKLIEELMKPDVWIKIGATILGFGLSQFLWGSPLSLISMILGSAILVAAIPSALIRSFLQNEEGIPSGRAAVVAALYQQGKEIPAAMLSGFLIGLLVKGISA